VDYKRLEQLKKIMEEEVQKGIVKGSAIRVLHNNKVVYDGEIGYADKEMNTFIKKDTIYRMYSMSKPVTAVATMILFEKGMLHLLDPVSMYLDGFKNQKVLTKDGLVDAKRESTIQDLLNMTSGVVYPDLNYEVGAYMDKLYKTVEEERKDGSYIDTVALCNRIGREPLEFHPGERWRYGASADILGAIIEVVSGKTFGEFLDDEIFSPLGMIDTGFYIPEDKLSRFAEIYEYNEENKQLEPCTWSHLGLNDFKSKPEFESGGAGLVSTIEDYTKFALMLSNGGTYNGIRILGSKTMEYLGKPQLSGEKATYKDWPSMVGYEYGNLMRYLTDQVEAASIANEGIFGWDGWTGNYFFIDPKENLVMIYMVQNVNGTNTRLVNKFQTVIYSAL
jgi:CubicO group peptidase (beta-lactamase class C family)